MSVEVLIVLAVIAVLLLVFWSRSNSGASSDSSEIPSKPAFVPPPEKTDEELVADYQSLMRELPDAFLVDDPKPSKSDMSKLQRLSRLSALPIIQPIIDQSAVLELLDAGLEAVEPVYGPADKTGKSRLQAYTKATRKLRPAGAQASPVKTQKAPSAKASSSGEKQAKKVGVATPRTGRFGFPFDVDAFAASLPKGWRLVDELDENNVFMHGPNGAIIEGGPHQMAPSSNLRTAFEDMVDQFDDSDEIEEFVTSIGSKGWSVVGEWNDAGVFAVELYGPALMSARFVYHDETLDQRVVSGMKKAASELNWLHESENIGSDPNPKSIKELRRHISDILKGDKELRDEILASYGDDESLYVSLTELEAIAILGPKAYPTVRAMIRYALSRAEIDVEDLTTLRTWCDPHFLNDPSLKEEIASKAVSAASTTSDFLSLAEAAAETGDAGQAAECVQSAFNALASTDDYLNFMAHEMITLNDESAKALLNKAIEAARDLDDLRAIINAERATEELVAPILKHMRKSAKDSEFFNSAFNPLDVLQAACERGFIEHAAVEPELVSLLKASPMLADAIQSTAPSEEDLSAELAGGISLADIRGMHGPEVERMHLLSMAESAYGEEWEQLRETLLSRALKAATTPERKYAIYTFMTDKLEDEGRAKAYLKANRKVLKPFLDQLQDAQRQEQLIDSICQCALLVAVGDGRISEEESDEVQQVRAIVDMMYRNRAAIEILEKTEDIEQARQACGSTILVTTSTVFQPAYIREVIEELSEVSSMDELEVLFRSYASRIEDPFGRRLAAWAANEVASVDGLDDGEKRALKIMADVWKLNLQENQRYFRDFVYPATNENIEFTGRSSGSDLDRARAIDAELAELGDDAASMLADKLGVDSFEAAMRLLGVKEDEEAVEDTEDLPPIFEALLHRGDWDEVMALVHGGADVNETINLNGIKGISILTLACEHGTAEIAKALVEAGADVNRPIGNPKRASGYNSPLTASLKNGGRMDIFNYLLKAGANPDPFADRESGWTPLTIAAQNENHKAIKALIERGVDVNVANSDGANAFKLLAADETPSSRKCMDLLIKAGIDTARTDDEGFAGIHNAVCSGSPKHVQYLIETANVPVDLPMRSIPGLRFHTPMLQAMSWGNIPVVDYLLSKGADPSARNQGKSIFSAIARASIDESLADPVSQVRRFIEMSLEPDFEDILSILGSLAHGEPDDNPDDNEALGECLKEIVAGAKFGKEVLSDIDGDDISEEIEEALANAPETSAALLELLKARGVDLEALGTSAEA
jgi:ankyrin repeat protein